MNKKILIGALLAGQLMTQAYAGGDMEAAAPEVVEAEEAEAPFYIVAKALSSLGADAEHGEAVLSGAGGYGTGLDFGYRLGKGFAVECDVSYAKNRVTEVKNNRRLEEMDAHYTTSSVDFLYVYDVSENFGVFGKVGYEYEWETIDDLGIDNSREHGFIAGVGIETKLSETYKFVAEYEHSTIDSPRGDSLYAGIMYNF